MKVTFILKDLSDQFYNGFDSIPGLLNLPDNEKFFYLQKMKEDLSRNIKMKVGPSDSFRDKCELNDIVKRGPYTMTCKLEPRKGYKLATFEVERKK